MSAASVAAAAAADRLAGMGLDHLGTLAGGSFGKKVKGTPHGRAKRDEAIASLLKAASFADESVCVRESASPAYLAEVEEDRLSAQAVLVAASSLSRRRSWR